MKQKNKTIMVVLSCATSLLCGGKSAVAAEQGRGTRSFSETVRSIENNRAEKSVDLAPVDIAFIVNGLRKNRVLERLNAATSALRDAGPRNFDSFERVTPGVLSMFSGGAKVSAPTSLEEALESTFESKNYAGTLADDHSHLYMVHKSRGFSSDDREKMISEKEALKRAEGVIEELKIGIPFSAWWKVLKLVSIPGGTSSAAGEGSVKPTPVAYKIHGRGLIGDVPIAESKYLVSLFLDGSVHKVSFFSPRFEIKPRGYYSRLNESSVAKTVQDTLKEYPLSRSWKDLEFLPVFTVRNGQVRPAVRVLGTLRYSPANSKSENTASRKGAVIVGL